jgi:cardiolipin synthase
VLILSRDAVLIAGSFYVRYLIIPPPKTWSKFWDIERSGFKITPNLLGKFNTLLQLMLIGFTMGSPIFHYIDHPLLQALWYITGCTTVASGLTYCVQMKGFKIMKQQNKS